MLSRMLLFLGLSFSFGWAMRSNAQQQYFSYSMKRLSQDDGLSQGSNYFRYEDRSGFMWITGNDALNRFDGSMIKVYNLNRYFKDCPPLQQGYGFTEDDEGNIYIGSVNGLYIYHRKTDQFTLQKIYPAGKEELAIPFAFKDQKVWCFNRQYEIASYNITTGRINPIVTLPLPAINSVHVYDMVGPDGISFYYRFPLFDNQNNLWVFGKRNLYQFNIHKRSLQEIKLNAVSRQDAMILCSCFDRSRNELLIGTNKGLVRYQMLTGQERFTQRLDNLNLGEVSSIAYNDHAIALRSTFGSLLTNRDLTHYYFVDPADTFNRRVYDLGFDKAGRLWVCDDGRGQAIYSFSQPLLSRIPGTNNDFVKLKEKGVSGFAEMADGDIFFHNDFVLEHGSGKLKPVEASLAVLGYKWGFRAETDLLRKGVWLYRINGARLELYFAGKDKRPQLSQRIPVSAGWGACNTLRVLNDGRIIVSFSSALFWLQHNRLVPINTIPNRSFFTISPLNRNRYAISYLNKDMLLVTTDSTRDIKPIRTILNGVQSFYMQEDTLRRRYWTGTNKGIYLLDRDFNILQHFDANNGLAGTYIYGLLLDEEGNAWCSHQHGLSSIDTRTFQITNYDKEDGIQDWDFNNRAFYKATDGTLYFGGVAGFNYFKPPLQPVSFYAPEVYVDEILVNNRIYLPDSGANEIRELHLLHHDNNIVVKALIKDLDNSSTLVYRLRESDAQWKHLPGKGLLTFNSLAPGDYLLELGVFDKYRHLQLHQRTIRIFIEAPFYLRAWFWVIVAILITALVAWRYHRIRLGKQRTDFRQQLALEKQRSKITADLHDDIGASLSSLQVNSMVAHELLQRQPERAARVLEKIASQSKELSERIGDIIWSMKPGKEEFMTLSSRIRSFANDIISDTGIQYDIDIDKEANVRITDITMRKNIVFIVKEAINNAVKYSKAAVLQVTLRLDDTAATLIIYDGGVGFICQQHKGNGIANMKRRAAEINGEWLLETTPGKGTRISITIPLPN